jgi:hypothetical protein
MIFSVFLPSSRMDDFHFPVFALTAGFPRLSIDPSSVMRDMVFESSMFEAITIFSAFSETSASTVQKID